MPKAFVMINVHPGKEQEAQEEVRKMPGVQFVHQVTGAHDMIAFVDADPYEELAVIISKIRKLDSVRVTDTELVLR
ncbi:MAG: AsnC family transcriptional regulator [Candidatus Omnitrophica bacterium CG11_big_fil_rev_8_21_14_0_20_64_10]|nr:MAG: AsnC family transcriptional regulator [Candidatus Omnitrophica bacterium CG11_big_fil_rev_8_21_14_0_20_64_10]